MADLNLKKEDFTRLLKASDRRLDSITKVINGANICTAICCYQQEFLISNNTGEEDLPKQFFLFFKSYFQKKGDFSQEEAARLLGLSYEGARSVLKKNLKIENQKMLSETSTSNITVNRQNLNGHLDTLKQKLSDNQQKLKQCEIQFKELSNYAKWSTLNDKLMKVGKTEENKEEEKKEEGDSSSLTLQEKKKKDQRKAKESANQVKNLQNSIKGITNYNEFEQKQKEMEKIEKDISNYQLAFTKCENQIQGLDNVIKDNTEKENAILDNIEEKINAKRGCDFKIELKRAMLKILEWIDDQPEQFMKNNNPDLYTFVSSNPTSPSSPAQRVHAEMCLIQFIYDNHQESSLKNKNVYIGINKLCCFKCHVVIQAIRKMIKEERIGHEHFCSFETRGSHNKYYEKWGKPRFYSSLPKELVKISRKEINQICLMTKNFGEEYMNSESEPEPTTITVNI